MEIEIYSDVVCPWCYLGAYRLQVALATFDADVTLRWRPFQLDSGAPGRAQPLLEWLGPRFGGLAAARQAMARVVAVAAEDGLRIDVERALIVKTFDAHRLLWFADQPAAVVFGASAETQPDLAHLLYRAHLVDGLDVGDHETLVALADQVGLDQSRVAQLLASTEGTADVRAQLSHADDLAITAVPTFVIDGAFRLSGAQDVGVIRATLAELSHRKGLVSELPSIVPRQRPAGPGQRPATTFGGDSRFR